MFTPVIMLNFFPLLSIDVCYLSKLYHVMKTDKLSTLESEKKMIQLLQSHTESWSGKQDYEKNDP